jgi:hypothetical protein
MGGQEFTSMEWFDIATNQQQFIVEMSKRWEAQDVANKQTEKNIRAENCRHKFRQGFLEGVFLSSVLVLGWILMR